mmetsp:Transcript_44069/g.139045  ORF Transcript_44069/g.139045 Transcript_44069/m.139045 type:complete len:343 (+) Transcript_44069:2391-3419(+)
MTAMRSLVLVLFILLLLLVKVFLLIVIIVVVVVVVLGLPSEPLDGVRDDALLERDAHLVVRLELHASALQLIIVQRIVFGVRDVGGAEEVEEALARLRLGDCAGSLAVLASLLLLLDLDGDILAAFPCDLSSLNLLKDRVVRRVGKEVGLCKDFVGEKLVLVEVELEAKTDSYFLRQSLRGDIREELENHFVLFGDVASDDSTVLHSPQPEIRNSSAIRLLSILRLGTACDDICSLGEQRLLLLLILPLELTKFLPEFRLQRANLLVKFVQSRDAFLYWFREAGDKFLHSTIIIFLLLVVVLLVLIIVLVVIVPAFPLLTRRKVKREVSLPPFCRLRWEGKD